MITQAQIDSFLAEKRENKKRFPPGPWQTEPDRVEFKHAGFDCLLNRNQMGAWCGYVGLPATHPLYKTHYQEVENLSGYGGLTFGALCGGEICHVGDVPGEALYWLGFDCAHYGDLVPGMILCDEKIHQQFGFPRRDRECVYRDVHYAREQTKLLAEELQNI